jgi:hypothetical protein
MTAEKKIMFKDAIVAYFKLIYRHSPEGTEESREEPQT